MKKINNPKIERRIRRHVRVRSRVSGTHERPRLSVYRSNKFMYAQLVDDIKGSTILFVTDKDMKNGTKLERAKEVGKKIAESAKAKKINKVVFDRGGFLYAGRIKTLADAAREGGLEF